MTANMTSSAATPRMIVQRFPACIMRSPKARPEQSAMFHLAQRAVNAPGRFAPSTGAPGSTETQLVECAERVDPVCPERRGGGEGEALGVRRAHRRKSA